MNNPKGIKIFIHIKKYIIDYIFYQVINEGTKQIFNDKINDDIKLENQYYLKEKNFKDRELETFKFHYLSSNKYDFLLLNN